MIQYFTLCDQLSKDMTCRRTSLLSDTGEGEATLVTFDGSTLEGTRTVTSYEQVPPICRNDLGLATSPYYSSHNDSVKTFEFLQVHQPSHTPSRNTFWDAEMECRLSIDTVRANRESAVFLLPKGESFPFLQQKAC